MINDVGLNLTSHKQSATLRLPNEEGSTITYTQTDTEGNKGEFSSGGMRLLCHWIPKEDEEPANGHLELVKTREPFDSTLAMLNGVPEEVIRLLHTIGKKEPVDKRYIPKGAGTKKARSRPRRSSRKH